MLTSCPVVSFSIVFVKDLYYLELNASCIRVIKSHILQRIVRQCLTMNNERLQISVNVITVSILIYIIANMCAF